MKQSDFPTRRQALLELLQADFDGIFPRFPLAELGGRHIFLTGATGFVGYWLLQAFHWLNRHGTEVQVTALSRDPERFLASHPECRSMAWLAWVRGDIKTYAWPAASYDAILHGAADTSLAAANNPLDLFDDIVLGSRRVLDHAAATGIKRLLLVSSGAVYGEQPATLARLAEDFPGGGDVLDPRQAYGEAKRAMEMLATAARRQCLVDPVIARCFSFIGYSLPRHLAINQFIEDALAGESITIAGDGEPVRSYLHAADLAVWLLALLARGRSGEAYNVGSPAPLSLRQVAEITRDTLAPGQEIRILGQAGNAPRQRYVPDTRRIEAELGVNCWTSVAEAIGKTAAARALDGGSG